jgi:pimeloyl-ACP methyl ester carboxylesterase
MTGACAAASLGPMTSTKASRRAAAFSILLIGLAVLALVLMRNPGRGPLGLRSCTIAGHTADCGVYNAPENPAQPSGKRIRLNVAVFPATSGHPKPDPLFWFAGWGGAGVSDDAGNVLSALRRVNIDRDVVFIDQRGTGSSKLSCALPAGPSAPTAAALTTAARHCAAVIGPRLRYYTSAIAVDDFDRIRHLLGYRKINVYGVSYGVTTGQIYLLRHGAHVRTAAFDSGSLLDVHIFERAGVNAQRALDLLFARCASDTACSTAHPQIAREFKQLLARLAPVSNSRETVRLDRAGVGHVVEEMLATFVGKAELPRLIELVAKGQTAQATKLARPFMAGSNRQLAYQLLIQCSEPWASWRPGQVERLARGTFMEAAQRQSAAAMSAICRGLPRAPVPSAIGERLHSDIPILLLTGNEDPADPPASVAGAARELPNSRTVVFPNSGHGQLGLLCAQNLIADLVTTANPRALDASCAKSAVQSEFAISG